MGNDSAVSGGSLGQFLQALIEEGNREERRCDQQTKNLRASALKLAGSPWAATRLTAFGALKAVVAEIERSLTNSENRRGKEGRQPTQAWPRRCGMDPVDALLIWKILTLLGAPVRAADFDKMLETHAIACDSSMATIEFRGSLKSLREGPRGKIKLELERRVAALPNDVAGLQAALAALAARALPEMLS